MAGDSNRQNYPRELVYEAIRHLRDEVVFISDNERRMRYVTPSVTEVLGHEEAAFLAFSRVDLIHPDDLPMAAKAALELRGAAGSYRLTLRLRHADGRWIWCDVVGRNLMEGPVGGFVNSLRDVSAQRALEERLALEARRDELTGVSNRRGFLETLEAVMTGPSVGRIGLLMLDLDEFKAVNDRLGHPAGDALLVEVAKRIQSALRPGDVVGRLGGDEFALLIHRADDDVMLEGIAQRLRGLISEPYTLPGGEAKIGVSVGAARARADDSIDDLIRVADGAPYEAKAAGRDAVRVAVR